MNHAQHKALERLRELANDRVASTYLVGVLIARTAPDEYADLVEAALVFRERFGAPSNDWRQAPPAPVADRDFICRPCGNVSYCLAREKCLEIW